MGLKTVQNCEGQCCIVFVTGILDLLMGRKGKKVKIFVPPTIDMEDLERSLEEHPTIRLVKVNYHRSEVTVSL